MLFKYSKKNYEKFSKQKKKFKLIMLMETKNKRTDEQNEKREKNNWINIHNKYNKKQGQVSSSIHYSMQWNGMNSEQRIQNVENRVHSIVISNGSFFLSTKQFIKFIRIKSTVNQSEVEQRREMR